MRSALLMAHQDMLHIILLVKSIINMQYGTTRVPEYMLNAFGLETLYNYFCASQFHCRYSVK
jgi:hypothetical protein